ncbi:hypothetical protein OAO01_06325 [Oligoflexia bacterium]|nr:hypothetical protein [Oligoflexia bacterium]
MKIAIFGLLFCAWLCAVPQSAAAKFLKTSQGVYQNTVNLGVKIITTPEGIFILEGQPIELQELDARKIPAQGALHAFIKYDSSTSRYVSLFIGSKSFSVKGSFTLHMGSIRITLDNNNPYCSIVFEDRDTTSKTAPDVLGILGIDPIVNSSGTFAVALLEANKFNEFRGLIEPYYLKPQGLLLKQKVVTTASIGLALEQRRSQCLKKDSVLLLESEIKAVQAIRSKQARINKLNAILKKKRDKTLLQDLLILRTDPKATVGLDYKAGKVYVIRPFQANTGIIKGSEPKTCVVGTVNLN